MQHNSVRKSIPPENSLNKATAISAELLELNFKTKLEDTGKNRKKVFSFVFFSATIAQNTYITNQSIF